MSPGVVPSTEATPSAAAFGGVKGRFVASSPNRVPPPESSPRFPADVSASPRRNGLRGSGIRPSPVVTPKKKVRPLLQPVSATSSLVQTPDWIRDIFSHAKRGDAERLVMFHSLRFVFRYQISQKAIRIFCMRELLCF
jgi:hypothetical protein